MFKIALLEYFDCMKRSFRLWKVISILIMILLFVSDAIYESTGKVNISKFYVTVWICLLLRPKVSKVNYLLPNDRSNRAHYLICSTVGCILIVSFGYIVIYFLNVLVGTYGVLHAIRKFFCMDLFLIILITIYTSGTAYHGRVTYAKGERTKIILSSFLLCLPVLMVIFLSPVLSGLRLIGITVFAYACLIPCFVYVSMEFKRNDTCYENIRQSNQWRM